VSAELFSRSQYKYYIKKLYFLLLMFSVNTGTDPVIQFLILKDYTTNAWQLGKNISRNYARQQCCCQIH
jgi:hypothetical protein